MQTCNQYLATLKHPDDYDFRNTRKEIEELNLTISKLIKFLNKQCNYEEIFI